MRTGRALAAGAVAALLLAGTSGCLRESRAWSEEAEEDLRFIHEALARNHPGPVDTLVNPWFREWHTRGLDEALTLAERAAGYAGYYFAVQRYVRGFQDNHLVALRPDPLADHRLDLRWPGVVVGYRNRAFEVVASEEPRVPMGAVLESCDGRTSSVLAESIIQQFHGRWMLKGERPQLAPYLLLDAGNPHVPRPTDCIFKVDGRSDGVRLDWRSADLASLRHHFETARQVAPRDFGVRTFAGGRGTWISLPTFRLLSDSATTEFDRVLDVLRREGDTIRRQDLVVLDVRGNRGGSSLLGGEVVSALWGDAVAREVEPVGIEVDWRLSEANIRHIRSSVLPGLEARYGPEARDVAYYRRLVVEMEAALKRGETFHRERSYAGSAAAAGRRHAVRARVFLVTDHLCASACLDFVDAIRAVPGVVHVGRETSADAVYMEIRSVDLPSRLGRLSFSMKVYRNRPRGNNESWVPHHTWTGDIRDDDGIERWLLASL